MIKSIKNKQIIHSTKLMKIVLLFIFALFATVSCTNSTESSKGSLSGTVLLEGEDDNSGVTVAVYALAYLDTTIVRINSEYPHIGVIINQHTEFDHRFQSPLYQTTTNADGSFKIKDITSGKYNFVAAKSGWGFRYIYEINISKGDNSVPNTKSLTRGDIVLYKETTVSGNVEGEHIFEPHHHYIIEDHTSFVPGSRLEIQPGAVMRINPGKDLKIYGDFKAQGEMNNMFWVTSNSGFSANSKLRIKNLNSKIKKCVTLSDSENFRNSIEGQNHSKFKIQNSKLQGDEIALYNSMNIQSTATIEDDKIEWGKWDWGSFGLEVDWQNGLTTENCVFRGQTSGLYIKNSDENIVRNVIAQNSNNDSYGGVYFLGSNTADSNLNILLYNILLNNSVGIQINRSPNFEVKNNYFSLNGISVLNQFFSTETLVEYNDFSNDTISIENAANSTVYVYYNNINSEIGVNNTTRDQFGISFAYSNYNNFYCSEYAVRVTGRQFANQPHIDAKHNWWGTTNIEAIEEMIWDRNNIDSSDPEYYSYALVDFQPFRNQKISDSGVQ